MSSRIACSEREATIGSARPSTNTLVRRRGPRSSSIGMRPRIASERQYFPYPSETMRPRWMSIRPLMPPTLANIRECHGIDFPIHPHAHVVILPIHEIRERFEELCVRHALRRVEPLRDQQRLELADDRRRDRDQIFGPAREEVELMQPI